jgi:prophage DNA circulation protein
MIHIATFSTAFSIGLDLARRSAATVVTLDRVRKAALAEVPISLPAIQTVLAIVRLTLAAEARVLAYLQFRSRDEVDAIALAINAAFAQTSEIAANDLDAATYAAILRLHGSVVQHLTMRGRLLPRVMTYSFQAVMPALRMAQMAYASAERWRELVDENSVVHPLFCQREGKMLAV